MKESLVGLSDFHQQSCRYWRDQTGLRKVWPGLNLILQWHHIATKYVAHSSPALMAHHHILWSSHQTTSQTGWETLKGPPAPWTLCDFTPPPHTHNSIVNIPLFPLSLYFYMLKLQWNSLETKPEYRQLDDPKLIDSCAGRKPKLCAI